MPLGIVDPPEETQEEQPTSLEVLYRLVGEAVDYTGMDEFDYRVLQEKVIEIRDQTELVVKDYQ